MTPGGLVARIDHFYARVEQPRLLFETLHERFGLPRSYGFARVPGLEGGAVSMGNVVFLEALRYVRSGSRRHAPDSGLHGLALESAVPLEEVGRELSERLIPHAPVVTYTGDPAPFAFADPLQQARLRTAPGPLWSMVALGGFLGERWLARLPLRLADSAIAEAFGRQQGRLMGSQRFGDIATGLTVTRHPMVWLHRFDVADMSLANAAAREQLEAASGGRLGLKRVKEVVLGAVHAAPERERWQRLLEPIQPGADGAWPLADGPALRLVDDEVDRIQALVCEVSSLERARLFLDREGLLADAPAGEVRVARDALQGVDLRLVEARADSRTADTFTRTEAPA